MRQYFKKLLVLIPRDNLRDINYKGRNMLSKLIKSFLAVFFLVLFSFLISAQTFSSPAFAQTESMDEMSADFEESVQRLEEEYDASVQQSEEEFEDRVEETEVTTSEEFESNVEDMELEYEAFVEQSEAEYEARKSEIAENYTGIFGAISALMIGLFGVTALGTLLMSIFVIIILLLVLGGLVFDIMMVVDCLNREFEDRTIWLVILIVGGLSGFALPVALVYYFTVKKKLDSNK